VGGADRGIVLEPAQREAAHAVVGAGVQVHVEQVGRGEGPVARRGVLV